MSRPVYFAPGVTQLQEALESLVSLVPGFTREVAPPLGTTIAECLAVYWFVAIANESIDDESAERLASSIVPVLTSKNWSVWNGDAVGLVRYLGGMCQTMAAGKDVAMAMGAGQVSLDEQRMLYVMNVAKCAVATAGLDDTNSSLVEPIMTSLAELHQTAWPIIRSAGRPRPISPIIAQRATGCMVLFASALTLAAIAASVLL